MRASCLWLENVRFARKVFAKVQVIIRPDAMASSSASSPIGWLPPELLRACFATLNASELLIAAKASRAFFHEAGSDELWAALYARKWPPWTLLVPDTIYCASHGARIKLSKQELYRRRLLGRLRLKLSPSVLVLRGDTTDDYDGNTTPLDAVMCVADGELSNALEIGGKLVAQVHFGIGTLHNSSAIRCWLGKQVAVGAGPHQIPLQLGSPYLQAPPVHVEWREHSPTFGHWIYEGHVSRDGMVMDGTFHLSILKRKTGRFRLVACDPATHVGDALGGLPTANQLVKRVAVKWCTAALAKLSARDELMVGA